MKLALQGLHTVPRLKAACKTALAAALEPGGGVRQFFWAAREGLAAQLQHGVSVEQGCTQEAAVVVRKYMVGCAHVACMLVSIYNMLLDGPPQQQQGAEGEDDAAAMQQQQGAGGGGAAAGVQQQHPEGMLPCELSDDAKRDGMQALQAACNARAPGGQLTVQQLLQREQLPTLQDPHNGKHTVAVITGRVDVRPLVQGLCPALDALLALRPSANRLPIVTFSPPFTAQQLTHAVEQQGWSGELLNPCPAAQLLSRQGVLLAFQSLPHAAIKSSVTRLCDDTQRSVREVCARAAQHPHTQDCGAMGLLWGLLGVVRSELEVGITARVQSNARVDIVMRDYVVSVAHVASTLVHMYNALLVRKLQAAEPRQKQKQQQQQQQRRHRPGRGQGRGFKAAGGRGRGAPAQQQGHGMTAAPGGGDGGGNGCGKAAAGGHDMHHNAFWGPNWGKW
jgi:hypothetical protein